MRGKLQIVEAQGRGWKANVASGREGWQAAEEGGRYQGRAKARAVVGGEAGTREGPGRKQQRMGTDAREGQRGRRQRRGAGGRERQRHGRWPGGYGAR